jgi:hypothetical protein
MGFTKYQHPLVPNQGGVEISENLLNLVVAGLVTGSPLHLFE